MCTGTRSLCNHKKAFPLSTKKGFQFQKVSLQMENVSTKIRYLKRKKAAAIDAWVKHRKWYKFAADIKLKRGFLLHVNLRLFRLFCLCVRVFFQHYHSSANHAHCLKLLRKMEREKGRVWLRKEINLNWHRRGVCVCLFRRDSLKLNWKCLH